MKARKVKYKDPSTNSSFNLVIRQQPLQARTSNLKDGRPLEPCPIVELIVKDDQDKRVPYTSFNFTLYYACVILENAGASASSRSTKVKHDTDMVHPAFIPSLTDDFDGKRISECNVFRDPDTKADSLFFLFPDIFCRAKGSYRLLFKLIKIPESHTTTITVAQLCLPVYSQSFIVHNPREYPGKMPVTALSSSFLEQGVGIKMKSKRFMEPSGIYESDDVSADDESTSTKPSADHHQE